MTNHFKIKSALNGIFFLFFLLPGQVATGQQLNFVFKSGGDGYQCYRIPALVTTTKGTLLAFAEARKNNCGDAGDIDLVLKRSFDGGKTWTALQLVWSDSNNTCGNPAPVVDKKTGNIILLSTWNLGSDHEPDIIANKSVDTRRIFVLSSSNDGATWTTPQEITKDVKQDNWTWYATGPGSGIQIQNAKFKGRLVLACDHIESGSKKYYSHTVYSDDGGKKWLLGGTTPKDKVNESTVAELSNGDLMLNMRNFSDVRFRQVSISKDGNVSWSEPRSDTTLVEPVCQGSLIRYNYPGKKPFLVFSNPASKTSRTRMTVRISHDDGKTWLVSKLLYAGPSAYSNVGVLPNGNIACLFEAGYKSPYEGIVFEEIGLKEFTR